MKSSSSSNCRGFDELEHAEAAERAVAHALALRSGLPGWADGLPVQPEALPNRVGGRWKRDYCLPDPKNSLPGSRDTLPAVADSPPEGGSNRPGHQIVVRVADDLDARKFANRQFAAKVNPPVNVRRVGFAAGNQKVTGDG